VRLAIGVAAGPAAVLYEVVTDSLPTDAGLVNVAGIDSYTGHGSRYTPRHGIGAGPVAVGISTELVTAAVKRQKRLTRMPHVQRSRRATGHGMVELRLSVGGIGGVNTIIGQQCVIMLATGSRAGRW
jgi:hypothetical protein